MGKYNDWTNMAGLAGTIVRAREDSLRLQSELGRTGSDAAELIAHAWNFAGAEDSEANKRGAVIIRHARAISALLVEISTHLTAIQNEMKKAVAAIDEGEAKRKSTRSKLDV